jgi:putative addiction module CopG family antidote
MPNLTVNLTPDLHDFVLTNVRSGRYENANELVRVALNTLRSEARDSVKKRSASDNCYGDPFRKLWEKSNHSCVSPQKFRKLAAPILAAQVVRQLD